MKKIRKGLSNFIKELKEQLMTELLGNVITSVLIKIVLYIPRLILRIFSPI